MSSDINLWDVFGSLSDKAPIYMDFMDEDINSTPRDYVLIVDKTADDPFSFGDGKTLIRQKTFSIYVSSMDLIKTKDLARDYEHRMVLNDLNYSRYGLVVDETGRYSIELEARIIYGHD